ncbi:SDR family NAD(P)-dependent oxidoreductase [Dactylosporangium siamense]|uniref:Oxidoreductase n=1 Tax=Dactylosporangium siamense TaxID=685454 RepID=A0A919PY16_9ACTN|nr:SDR family oxidoreductase [Dactylosporangium siamense]GIG51351.1 oxidoreductase [Dactylosporangium siamense]
MPRLDPSDVAACLRVLAALNDADDDPSAPVVREAVVSAYKSRKKHQRTARRTATSTHDLRVLTADGDAGPEGAGQDDAALLRARRCYVCKKHYRTVNRAYPLMCVPCSTGNTARRTARCDLRGRRALVTGGRIKIGFQTALKLLRDGADVIVTTRFPHDAARRFAAEADFTDWQDRLRVHGVDFLDLPAVVGLVDAVTARWGHLDILINNAAQTISRPFEYHRSLRAAETAALEGAAAGTTSPPPVPVVPATQVPALRSTVDYFPLGAVDETGEPLDLRPVNSWVLHLHEVSPREWMEVQVVNSFVPFLLTARLRPLLLASPHPDRYVVNVSAMEGSFSRRNKTSRHPHTNMAKAGLNMLTRTIAADYARDGIHVTSVDTGWVTDERPQGTKEAFHEAGFRVPLDVVDGAARVYDPIVRGVHGDRISGVFLKDYQVVQW